MRKNHEIRRISEVFTFHGTSSNCSQDLFWTSDTHPTTRPSISIKNWEFRLFSIFTSFWFTVQRVFVGPFSIPKMLNGPNYSSSSLIFIILVQNVVKAEELQNLSTFQIFRFSKDGVKIDHGTSPNCSEDLFWTLGTHLTKRPSIMMKLENFDFSRFSPVFSSLCRVCLLDLFIKFE